MPGYFIQDEIGEIKIGYSEGNPHGRLRTFQTGNPRELKLGNRIRCDIADLLEPRPEERH